MTEKRRAFLLSAIVQLSVFGSPSVALAQTYEARVASFTECSDWLIQKSRKFVAADAETKLFHLRADKGPNVNWAYEIAEQVFGLPTGAFSLYPFGLPGPYNIIHDFWTYGREPIRSRGRACSMAVAKYAEKGIEFSKDSALVEETGLTKYDIDRLWPFSDLDQYVSTFRARDNEIKAVVNTWADDVEADCSSRWPERIARCNSYLAERESRPRAQAAIP